MVTNVRVTVTRFIAAFVVLAAPSALLGLEADEAAAAYGGLSVGGVFASVDGDAVIGPYASVRLPFGAAGGAWGLDAEALYELSGDPVDEADLAFAGQIAADWSVRRFLELPKRVELRAGARGGVYVEVDRTEEREPDGSASIDENVEPYPTAGIYLTGSWPFGSRVTLESRLTVDGIAAPRLGLNVGVRFR